MTRTVDETVNGFVPGGARPAENQFEGVDRDLPERREILKVERESEYVCIECDRTRYVRDLIPHSPQSLDEPLCSHDISLNDRPPARTSRATRCHTARSTRRRRA